MQSNINDHLGLILLNIAVAYEPILTSFLERSWTWYRSSCSGSLPFWICP